MPTTRIDDKVWWDRRRKLTGICDEILAIAAAGQNVLLLAHFEATLSEVEANLRSRALEIERIARLDSATVCSDAAGKLWSGLARFLSIPAPPVDDWGATKLRNTGASSANQLNILVTEHHPLRSRDEQLVSATAAFACEARLTFHISLDDPLLANFGVSSVQEFGKRLGIDEETFLSHPMITRAIEEGQQKIERKVPRDLPASSIEDWFKHNLPKT